MEIQHQKTIFLHTNFENIGSIWEINSLDLHQYQ